MRNKAAANADSGQDGDRSQPWLLSYNRRLRHLESISIRNLSSTAPTARRLSAALDDEALPQSLSTPAKLLSRHELRADQSRSSTDLTSIHEQLGKANGATESDGGPPQAPSTPLRRPSSRRLRRRSTLDWVNASPVARQKRLEKITSARLMDVFYTTHVSALIGPVEISETVHQTMNPVFQRLSRAHVESGMANAADITLKVWTRLDTQSGFECLLEQQVDLSRLIYLGSSLAVLKRPLPLNCVLFHMTDGIFVADDESIILPPPTITQPNTSKPSNTSSYDALMRLSNLDLSVRRAIQTRNQIEAEVNDLLFDHHQSLHTVRSVGVIADNANALKQATIQERRKLDMAARRRDSLRKAIQARREFMRAQEEDMRAATTIIATGREHIEAMKEALSQTDRDIRDQRRRLCKALQRIFPIEPVPSQPLAFTIRTLPLPNSVFDNTDDAVVSAALGHVAQLTRQLSFYLATPLPYPPLPRGSSSTITDPISATPMNATSAVYPLYSRGAPRFRFEYAVFLLNKNIQLLAARASLRLVDIRHTLPNLKYLLYVAASPLSSANAGQSTNGMRTFLRETSALHRVLNT